MPGLGPSRPKRSGVILVPMAKQAKPVRRARRAPQQPKPLRARRRMRAAFQLDQAALAHRRLLADPCNADLTVPVYPGLGTGQYRRYRSLIASEGLSVEGCYLFQLGTNTTWRASHVAATAGTDYTFSAAAPLFGATSLSGGGVEARCLAGCVKVRYVGAESARQGTIGMAVLSAPNAQPSGISRATTDTQRCPFVTRFGEVMHEVKFVPTQADEEFKLVGTSTSSNSVIAIVYRGIPASSLQFEVTGCYEINSSELDVTSSSIVPKSTNTLNHVLQSLGPISQWAYSHVVAPTIRSMASNVTGTAVTGGFARALAAPILAL